MDILSKKYFEKHGEGSDLLQGMTDMAKTLNTLKMAEFLGVSTQTVKNFCDKNGIKRIIPPYKLPMGTVVKVSEREIIQTFRCDDCGFTPLELKHPKLKICIPCAKRKARARA